MKRLVPRKLYGLKGNRISAQWNIFKSDFFAGAIQVAINSSAAVTTGFTLSGAMTTGILVSGATTNAVSITGACTSAINIGNAANTTNFVKFNAVAGCVAVALTDVDPEAAPSAGGLGATGSIVIDVGGTPYYIPIFDTLVT